MQPHTLVHPNGVGTRKRWGAANQSEAFKTVAAFNVPNASPVTHTTLSNVFPHVSADMEFNSAAVKTFHAAIIFNNNKSERGGSGEDIKLLQQC